MPSVEWKIKKLELELEFEKNREHNPFDRGVTTRIWSDQEEKKKFVEVQVTVVGHNNDNVEKMGRE